MSATNKAQIMATLTNERLEDIANGKGCIPLTVEAQQLAAENLDLRTQLAGKPYTVPDEIDVKDPALDTHRKWMAEGWNRCRATMLQSTGSEPSPMVTVEHRRVIEMLLSVCAAAFEIADDTCNQEVDGEWCHVVPDNSFSRLSDALDNIENSLPSEYAELPNTVLQWATVPRHALRALLQPALNGGTE
ncbi:hypothetical protein IG611_15435 [Pectobacterium sp. A535-S3-A17]|uniref:hypothetical protein n=1 Tax=Pectobacterium quasiaquaticum TaxID=2774015 RepID=UPI00187670BD|nr:hypothetical protein [Pectobacterium quasiaquaticum]MBE5226737.1 hypothetical protein [Pectobacterium quasiaquaticum]